mmetsp:Transcript_7689/g.18888  ORF Transcript_7689/g.18888 Transcript_7689/m.18888 type:complete len:222 (+) Transcript_7689:442-1107(+)
MTTRWLIVGKSNDARLRCRMAPPRTHRRPPLPARSECARPMHQCSSRPSRPPPHGPRRATASLRGGTTAVTTAFRRLLRRELGHRFPAQLLEIRNEQPQLRVVDVLVGLEGFARKLGDLLVALCRVRQLSLSFKLRHDAPLSHEGKHAQQTSGQTRQSLLRLQTETWDQGHCRLKLKARRQGPRTGIKQVRLCCQPSLQFSCLRPVLLMKMPSQACRLTRE